MMWPLSMDDLVEEIKIVELKKETIQQKTIKIPL